MLFIYGDSHAHFSFKHLSLPHCDRHEKAITMFRIGRDQQIIHYHPHEHDDKSISCIVYGEVDCRCHIHRQRLIGRDEDDVIHELVSAYIKTIVSVFPIISRVVVVAVIPPTRQVEYEAINGPIQHEFPFVGTDDDRVRYTTKVNHLLRSMCESSGILFIDPYVSYRREDGTLRYELSDQTVHLGKNQAFLDEFSTWYTRTFIDNSL